MLKNKNYKHKKKHYSKSKKYSIRRHKKNYLPKKKSIQIISYDDPRVRKMLDIRVYQNYLRDNSKGGTDNE